MANYPPYLTATFVLALHQHGQDQAALRSALFLNYLGESVSVALESSPWVETKVGL